MSSISMTALTTMSACRKRPRIERSAAGTPPRLTASTGLPCISFFHLRYESFQRDAERLRQPLRAPVRADVGDANDEPCEVAPAAPDALVDLERGAAERQEPA